MGEGREKTKEEGRKKNKALTESFFVSLLSGNVLFLCNKIVRLLGVKVSQ